MDADEGVSEQVFPLADPRLVAEGATVKGKDADFCVVRFDVGDFSYGKGDGFPVREKYDLAGRGLQPAVQPFPPGLIAERQHGQDEAEKDGIDQNGLHVENEPDPALHKRTPEQPVDE